MIVYRVENESGIGPYMGRGFMITEENKYLHEMADRHNANSFQWPPPMMDKLHGMTVEYYCGFSSPEKLQEWFDVNDCWRLFVSNMHISKYEISEKKVIFGEKQIAFLRDDAKLVETIGFEHIL